MYAGGKHGIDCDDKQLTPFAFLAMGLALLLVFIPASSHSQTFDAPGSSVDGITPQINSVLDQIAKFKQRVSQGHVNGSDLEIAGALALLEGSLNSLKNAMSESESPDETPESDDMPEMPKPDGNNVAESGSSGNPIMFALPGYGGMEKRDIWPDHHESFQVLFALNNMCTVNMDVQYTGGFMLFWDHDYDQDITNGLELGWTPHHPEDRTSYTYFSQSMFDFNGNGMLDRYDTLWHAIKVKDMATGRVYKPLSLGIVAFAMDGWKEIPDDYVTPGQYLDQDQYVKDHAYHDAINSGWKFHEIPEEHRHPVRALGWHPNGVIMHDDTRHPSFDVSMGYWGESPDCPC